jgi:hypothetical protein
MLRLPLQCHDIRDRQFAELQLDRLRDCISPFGPRLLQHSSGHLEKFLSPSRREQASAWAVGRFDEAILRPQQRIHIALSTRLIRVSAQRLWSHCLMRLKEARNAGLRTVVRRVDAPEADPRPSCRLGRG